jgi:hypothetical protein
MLRDAAFRLYNDLTTEVKQAVRGLDTEELENLVQASLRYMAPPEGTEEVTLPIAALKQMALFATQAAARQLYERHKK